MTYSIKHNPKADRDITEIYEYFSQFYASTPRKFLNEYSKILDLISFSPWFRKWDDDSNYRVANVRRYLVFFKVDDDAKTVTIHRILHGMRNFRQNKDIEVMEEQAAYGQPKI
jgi:plasmid stabilization system protein ParE